VGHRHHAQAVPGANDPSTSTGRISSRGAPPCTPPHPTPTPTQRYAKTIEVSKRIRWDIDRDIIRGREFDLAHKFLPDSLSLIDELGFLSAEQQRFLSQVQGAPTPTCSASSSASSAPRCSR
jgi:hypothetical protein